MAERLQQVRRSLAAFKASGKGKYLLVPLAILVLDQWTKWLVELHLPHHVAHPVVPGLLNLTHVRNTGVAFGLFAGGGSVGAWLLTLLGFLALSAVLAYFWITPAEERLLLVSLALILGGAVGNLLDRVVAGAVTDFIDVFLGSYHWPAFNIADSSITVGILLIAWETLHSHRRQQTATEA